jgi:hypothetical protein
MSIIKVELSQGLEQTGDDSEGTNGSLNRADNSEYHVNDNTIWKRKGRARFNSSAEDAALTGAQPLAPISASPASIFLIAKGTKWRSSAAGSSGSFSDAVTGLTGGVSLARAHLDRHFILGNGVDRGQVYGPDFPSFGVHSMVANASPPSIGRDSGSGTGFILTSGAVIEYWIEERVKVSGVIKKRGSPTLAGIATLTGDGSTDKPLITIPPLANSDTTHWALFATSTTAAFPVGAEIAEVAVGTTTIEDTRTGTDPTLPTGDTYETVNVTLAGVRQNVPLNGPAPIFDTAEVFEDSLCTNSKTDGEGNWLWFSFTRKPHAFPETNVVFLGDGETLPGKLKIVRQIGKVLVCLLDNQVWIVYQLPHPDDKLFQIERVKDKLAGALGVVGPLAAEKFVFADREVVAWVSHEGVMFTDSHGWDYLSEDLDWETLIEPSRIDKTVLVYNPRFFRLEMYYTPLGGTANTKGIYFHVHPSHLKQTPRGVRPKVTGPVDVTAGVTCAFATILSGRYETFLGTADGYLLRSNQGTLDEDNSAIAFAVDSKEYYFAGEGNETGIRKTWVHHRANPGQTLTVVAHARNEGQADEDQTTDMPLDRRELTLCDPVSRGASHYFEFSESGEGQIGLDYFAVDALDVAPQRARGSRA